jgi:signal transduction histidine kinase
MTDRASHVEAGGQPGSTAGAARALSPHALIPNAAIAAALLASYIALEWVSFIHEYKGVPITPWNPGLGVAFAVLILYGPAYAAVLFAGVTLAEIVVLRTNLPWPVIVSMAAIVSLCFTMAAVIERQYIRLDTRLSRIRDVLSILLLGTFTAMVSAGFLSLLLLAFGDLTMGDLKQAVVPLVVGDVIGIAITTPLILRAHIWWPSISLRAVASFAGELSLYLLIIVPTLWMTIGTDSPDNHKFLSFLFLPVVAAAVRHGIDGACVALAAAQLCLVAPLHWFGHDAQAFTEFQLVMLVMTTSGLLVGVVVSDRERITLSARKAELRLAEMQNEAARAARLNMVSGMASALSHEINQPMTAARALARSVQQLLRPPAPDLERANANLSGLVAQIDHAASVIRRMREFLRRGQPQNSSISVSDMLEDALALVRPLADTAGIRIRLELGTGRLRVRGDRVQLQQVVLNLVHNAIDAIRDMKRRDGIVRVQAYRRDAPPEIEISVIDNGGGVENGAALFEPLSSSKSEGLGLGLAICATIIQAHGGRIWLHASTPGATEFRFALPAHDKDALAP